MSFKEARGRQESSQADGAPRYMACSFCGQQTLADTLSAYGARCYACFQAYCGHVGPQLPEGSRLVTPNRAKLGAYLHRMAGAMRDTRSNPRAWAERLRDRHQSGECLTRAQSAAHQAVIGEANDES